MKLQVPQQPKQEPQPLPKVATFPKLRNFQTGVRVATFSEKPLPKVAMFPKLHNFQMGKSKSSNVFGKGLLRVLVAGAVRFFRFILRTGHDDEEERLRIIDRNLQAEASRGVTRDRGDGLHGDGGRAATMGIDHERAAMSGGRSDEGRRAATMGGDHDGRS